MNNRGSVIRWLLAAVITMLLAAGFSASLRLDQAAHHADAVRASKAGPSRHPTPAADALRAPRVGEVRALLARRASALRSGDLNAFLSGIDPAADPRFIAAQRAMFTNLRGVPLADWDYQLDSSETSDVRRVPPQPGSPAELWAPKVELDYAFAGVDPRPTSRTMGYLFSRHGEHWYLLSDTALDGLGVTTWRGPWDFGQCIAKRTASGLIISHPGGERVAAQVAAQLDPAVHAVSAIWGTDWPRQVVVLIPANQDELRALVGPEFATQSIAAVAVADYADARKHAAAGQRVVLNPGGAQQLSPTALAVVLRHEITHIAAREYTVDGAPMWMLEGFADYVGYASSGLALPTAAPDLAAKVRDGDLPDTLPVDANFGADSDQIDLAYQQAWSVNMYVAKRFSQAKLLALYHAVAGAGRVDAAQLDRLLHEVLGIGTADLINGWQQYLRVSFG